MKRFLEKCIGLFILVCGMILTTVLIVPQQYKNVYTSVLVAKYKRLMDMEEQKIILVGGSSMAFGMNSEELEKQTGMNVVNLGMHAGLGNRFCLEIARDNMDEGDVIIYAPEYWTETELQPELALISCQDNLHLLLDIPMRDRVNVIKTLPLYCRKKIFMFITNSGNKPNEIVNEYDPQFFNAYGDNVYNREKNIYSRESITKEPNVFNPEAISEELCEYVNEVNCYCNERGAKMFVSYAPVVEDSVIYDRETIDIFADKLQSKLDVEIISKPQNYIWPFEMFYGTNFHLNNKGAELRTQQLIDDLSGQDIEG